MRCRRFLASGTFRILAQVVHHAEIAYDKRNAFRSRTLHRAVSPQQAPGNHRSRGRKVVMTLVAVLNVPAGKKSRVFWFAFGKIDPVELLRQRPVSAEPLIRLADRHFAPSHLHVLRNVIQKSPLDSVKKEVVLRERLSIEESRPLPVRPSAQAAARCGQGLGFFWPQASFLPRGT